jgi:uncharacterized protein (TIGR02598 family)
MKTMIKSGAPEEGFSLVEVCLAVGLIGICVASMQGLLPAGIRVARDSTEQTACATMLSAVAADLRYTASATNVSPRYGISIPSSGAASSTNLFLAGDGGIVNSAKDARFGVSVSITNAPSSSVSSLAAARIKVYWPPTASVDKPQGSVETVAAFNRAMQKGGRYRTKVEYREDDDGNGSGGSGGSCDDSSRSGGCSGSDSGCSSRQSCHDRDRECGDDD